MQKDLIKQRFSKSIKTYDTSAVVQKQMAEYLSGMISSDFKNVLELGCGTGFLTECAVNRINFQIYDAIDMVQGCDEYISKISERVNFICSDIENISTDKKYDLVLSNASLQWVDDLKGFSDKVYTILNNGGQFVFTLFGVKNFKEMDMFLTSKLKYYTIDELKNIFDKFVIEEIEEKTNLMEFDTPIEVLHHIRDTGVNALSRESWSKSDLKNFEKNYPKSVSGKCILTYNPIYLKLKRGKLSE